MQGPSADNASSPTDIVACEGEAEGKVEKNLTADRALCRKISRQIEEEECSVTWSQRNYGESEMFGTKAGGFSACAMKIEPSDSMAAAISKTKGTEVWIVGSEKD
jgi:hypothetical protein